MDADETALREAWQAYLHGAVAVGVAIIRQYLQRQPQSGLGMYILACLKERAGAQAAADRLFARAARASELPQAIPCRVDAGRFRAAVAAAWAALPARFQPALAEVDVLLADYPPGDALPSEHPEEGELLGLFVGVERAEAANGGFGPRPQIYLFRRPHEHATSSMDDFRREIMRTAWHEFGHYLGFDEDGLAAMDLD